MSRAPLHVHHRHSETFCVLDGGATITVDDQSFEVGPGATVHIPKGARHSVSAHPEGLRMITTIAPGGFEGFFRDIAALPAPDPAEFAKIAARYDTEFLEPLPG